VPDKPAVVEGNVFDEAAAGAEAPVDAELTGLDQLEDDDMDDVDSLLDNVEVDVSGVMGAEEADGVMDDDMVMDLDEESLDDVLEVEPVPSEADDALPTETGEASPSLESLQATVRQLEDRVEELERRLRDEIAQLVPAEAAKIIREEIAALASELED
jgi:pilus assembly protein FimV